MTIKQLVKKLSKYPPETKVIVSSDSEGNCFQFLSAISSPENYTIEGYEISFLDSVDIKDGAKSKGKAIVLWP